MRDADAAERDVLTALQNLGVKVSAQALQPLRLVDFNKLVQVHDHEEKFLFDTFVSSLVTAHRARLNKGGAPEIAARDVSTALLMLGTAAAHASEAQISGPNKQAVKDSCPYC